MVGLVLHIAGVHLEIESVVQRPQRLFFRVVEVGNFVGSSKEADDGNGHGNAFIGEGALVQGFQQAVEHPVVSLEDFVEHNDMAFRYLVCRHHFRYALVL